MERPLAGTNFHCPKPIQAIEVQLSISRTDSVLSFFRYCTQSRDDHSNWKRLAIDVNVLKTQYSRIHMEVSLFVSFPQLTAQNLRHWDIHSGGITFPNGSNF